MKKFLLIKLNYVLLSCCLAVEAFGTYNNVEDNFFSKRKFDNFEKSENDEVKRLKSEDSNNNETNFWFKNVTFNELESKLKIFLQINRTEPNYLKSKITEFERFFFKEKQDSSYSNYFSLRDFLILELTMKPTSKKALSILGQLISLERVYSLEEFKSSIDHLASIFNNSKRNNNHCWCYSINTCKSNLLQALDYILYFKNFRTHKSDVSCTMKKSQQENDKILPPFLVNNLKNVNNNNDMINNGNVNKNNINYLENLLLNDEEFPQPQMFYQPQLGNQPNMGIAQPQAMMPVQFPQPQMFYQPQLGNQPNMGIAQPQAMMPVQFAQLQMFYQPQLGNQPNMGIAQPQAMMPAQFAQPQVFHQPQLGNQPNMGIAQPQAMMPAQFAQPQVFHQPQLGNQPNMGIAQPQAMMPAQFAQPQVFHQPQLGNQPNMGIAQPQAIRPAQFLQPQVFHQPQLANQPNINAILNLKVGSSIPDFKNIQEIRDKFNIKPNTTVSIENLNQARNYAKQFSEKLLSNNFPIKVIYPKRPKIVEIQNEDTPVSMNNWKYINKHMKLYIRVKGEAEQLKEKELLTQQEFKNVIKNIEDLQFTLLNHQQILSLTKNMILEDQFKCYFFKDNSAAIHIENGYLTSNNLYQGFISRDALPDFDGVQIQDRLKTYHDTFYQAYHSANELGKNNILSFFKAFNIAQCLDARLHPLQELLLKLNQTKKINKQLDKGNLNLNREEVLESRFFEDYNKGTEQDEIIRNMKELFKNTTIDNEHITDQEITDYVNNKYAQIGL